MTQSRQQGFSLIELMIAITVVAILASIAYPSYQNFILKSRRESARADLIANTHKIENYYTKEKKFSGYTGRLIQNKSTNFFTLTGVYDDNHYRLIAAPTARNSNESNRIVYDSIGGVVLCSDEGLTSCNPF